MPAAWEKQMRVGVGIAMSHEGPPLNSKHLMEMHMPKPHGVIFSRRYGVDMARNAIVENALEKEATHIIWLDEDVFPPIDGIMKLLRHGDDSIVSGIYYAKKEGEVKSPAAWGLNKDTQYCEIVDPKIYEDGVGDDGKERRFTSEVDAVGFGFCMTPVKLFDEIERPWFYFEMQRDSHIPAKEGKLKVSEDFYICRAAKEKGWKVMVDWSIRCDHLTWAFISGKDGSMEIARI